MIRNREFYEAVASLTQKCLPLIDPAIKAAFFPRTIEKYPNLEYGDSGFPKISSYPSRVDVSPFFEVPYSGKKADIELSTMEEYVRAFTIAIATKEIKTYFIYTDASSVDIEKFVDVLIRGLIKDFVERYYYLHGAEFDSLKFENIYEPIETYFYSDKLSFDISIPILFTKFDTDCFELAPTIAIRKISDDVHRARHSIVRYSPAIVDSVFMSATHELVLHHYSYERPRHVFTSVFSQPGLYPRQHIEKFLTVLKIETDITSGYAQFLVHPAGWAADYKHDVKPMDGASVRNYPSWFDDYFWNNSDYPLVTEEQLKNISKSFATLLESADNKLNFAIKRFYRSTMREEEEDIILDLIIALEMLLGDSGKTEMTQKLAYRMGGLLGNHSTSYSDANEVFENVKKIYGYRSSIIHGSMKASNKREIKLPENKSIAIVDLARDYLREVLKILIHNPKYLDVKEVDRLILGNNTGKLNF